MIIKNNLDNKFGFCEAKKVIAKKAGKFQPNLSQNLIYCQVTLYGSTLR